MVVSALVALLIPAATSQASPGATPATKVLSGTSPFPAPGPGTCGGAADPALQDSEFFPYIAANAADSDNLIAAWVQDDARANLVASSLDRGQTWKTVPLPGINDCTGNPEYQLTVHPEVSFGPSLGPSAGPYGRAYAVSSVFAPLPGSSEVCSALGCGEVPDSAILVNTSDDGGRTWSAPSRPSPLGKFPAVIVQDPHLTAHPKLPAVAYATWLEFDGAFETTVRLARTNDGALTWGVPGIVAAATTPGRGVSPAGVQVLNNSLVAVYVEADLLPSPPTPVPGPVVVWAVKSNDEGTTWSPPVMVASIKGTVVFDPDTGETLWPNFQIPGIAVGSGALYVVWHDVTGGPAPSARIELAKSNDGLIWTRSSTPVAQSKGQVFAPRIAVDRSGTLGVAFYDFRNDTPGDDRLTTDLWIRHSHDDGSSWQEDRLAGPFDIRAVPRFFDTWIYYPGLAGSSRGFVSVSSHLGGDNSSTNVFYTALRFPAFLP